MKWIDDLREELTLKKHEDELSLEERKVTNEQAEIWMPAILRKIGEAVTYFRQKFPHHQNFEGPKELPGTGRYYIATTTYPHTKIIYGRVATVFQFETTYNPTPDDILPRKETGVIQLKAMVNGQSWCEFKERRLTSPDDVAELLLNQFFRRIAGLQEKP